MSKIRCNACGGSGKVMGSGMMMTDCEKCDGYGKIIKDEPIKTSDVKIDKRSKHYKDAISKIKDLDKTITDERAAEIFESEYNKLELIK